MFIGVFEGATQDRNGRKTFHWTVKRVCAGPLNPGPLDGWGIGYGCHNTGYREGTRYLVSSRFAGGGDAFDTVAYELLVSGRVRLAPFPDQPSWTAPRRLRVVRTLSQALDLLVPARTRQGSDPDSGPGPSFVPSDEGKARDDLLALTIATDRTQVGAFEPIAITTTLRYTGPVEDKDFPFEKSDGFDAADPMAPFWRVWFADPNLRFPEGQYVITAYAHHGGRAGRCRAPWNTLTASVAIEVVPRSTSSPALTVEPSGAPAPSASPAPTGAGSGSESAGSGTEGAGDA